MEENDGPVSWSAFQKEKYTPEERNRFGGNLSARVRTDASTGRGFDLDTRIGKYVYETQDVNDNRDLGDLVSHLVEKNWMTPDMLWDVVILGRYRSGGK